MSWHFFELGQGLGRHKADWDGLNAALCGSNPFFDSGFIDNLLKHFAEGHEKLCVHESGGDIDAMLIVKPEKWGKWSLFLPSQEQIGPMLVTDASRLSSLLAALPGFTRSLLCPRQDPAYSPVTNLTSEPPAFLADHVRTVSVQINHSFANYWAARPKSLRKTIRNRFHRLEKAELPIKFVHLVDPADMAGAVARFGSLESKGWKELAGTAVHAENIQGKFYLDVMTDFAQRKKASAYEIYFGETLVASRICIASNNMLIILKTSYDEDFSEYAPGRLLLYMLLQHEFGLRRVETIEFYTNANSDHLAWATHERMIKHVKLFRSHPIKALYVFALEIRYALKTHSSLRLLAQYIRLIQKKPDAIISPLVKPSEFTDTAKPR